MYPLARPFSTLKSIDRLLPDLLKPLAKKRGFQEASILTSWPKVVGTEFATALKPSKISYTRSAPYVATLHVFVDPVRSLEVQYCAPQILERINTYLGYKAIAALKLHNNAALFKAPHISPSQKPITSKDTPKLKTLNDNFFETIKDPELKQALIELAESMNL